MGLVQRTHAGLQAARARGRQGGRPPGLAPRHQKIAPAVQELYEAGQQSTRQLMDYFQIGSRRTLYKILVCLYNWFRYSTRYKTALYRPKWVY